MTYSIIGILASIILLIINRDVLWNRDGRELTPTMRNYRIFLLGILCYYVTDLLWGILDAQRLTTLQYADTAVHFIAMAAAVMLWTRYVISYLNEKTVFGTILYKVGILFLVFEILVIGINFFNPIVFRFDESGGYHAGIARYITLAIQILLFLLTSIYTLYITSRTEGSVKQRHLTIGLFGIAMMACIAVQFFYPLLPFYAMGYLLGTCLLHSFVMEDEKDEYRRELEAALEREQLQKQELAESREALRDALAEAERANRAKTVFLSNMSHEIRTPMNAIIGLNNIALNEPTASEKIKEHLEKIGGSAQHLLGIINDILDMSRIESGRMVIKNEEFSFSDCLDQVNTIIIGQCREKGLQYKCRISGRVDDYYIGDAMKLKQVLINILGNAVKFTPEGGSVLFGIEEGPRFDKKASLRFIIADNGIGMSEEFLPLIFDAFSQEDTSASNRYGSTGLGMPITKSLVELMNGTIDVESEKGVGTTFTVNITLGESEKTAAAEMKETGTEPDAEEQGAEERQFAEAASDGVRVNEETPDQKADLKGKRVLLAEDVAINAEIIMMVLTGREMQVELAENGRIAVDMFSEHEPGYYDAVLMDMRMPEMDGLEATRAIRASEREDAGRIPIIALTANAFEEDVQRSMQAGLNAHLSKPVEPDVLYGTLERLIGD